MSGRATELAVVWRVFGVGLGSGRRFRGVVALWPRSGLANRGRVRGIFPTLPLRGLMYQHVIATQDDARASPNRVEHNGVSVVGVVDTGASEEEEAW